MSGSEHLTLRPADAGDSGFLLAWRNDPETRRMSRVSAVVAPEEHAAWFAGVLADPGRRLWVGESGGDRVGVVGASLRDPPRWEVSITVAPDHRGSGVGGRLLDAGVLRLFAEQPAATAVAFVRAENPASIRLFVSRGFVEVDRRDGFLIYERAAG